MWENEAQSWLARQIVNEAPDAVIVADREGVIRLWNRGAQMIFGFSPAEALGRSLHLIIPEKLRQRHDQGYRKVMQSGRTKYAAELLAVPAINKAGARLSVEFTVILLRDQQDHIAGAAAIIRDVSARWEQDRARQRRLAELEAQLKQDVPSQGTQPA